MDARDVGHQLVHLAREPREEVARVRGLAVLRFPVAHPVGVAEEHRACTVRLLVVHLLRTLEANLLGNSAAGWKQELARLTSTPSAGVPLKETEDNPVHLRPGRRDDGL